MSSIFLLSVNFQKNTFLKELGFCIDGGKLILVLLGMYFDAVVVFVTNQILFLRLVLAILCTGTPKFFDLPSSLHNAKQILYTF